MHLLTETIAILKKNGKTWRDVKWVGVRDSHCVSKPYFAANATEYDNGHTSQEVDDRLVVVGSDWWLERHEYDGSEWWEYKELPTRPLIKDNKPFIARVKW